MSNPSKKKGTHWETQVVELLKIVWPETHRNSTNAESHDIVVPSGFPVECKKAKTWLIPAWVRRIRNVAAEHRWAIFVSPGDGRKADSPGDIVVIDKVFAIELFQAWADLHRPPEREKVPPPEGWSFASPPPTVQGPLHDLN